MTVYTRHHLSASESTVTPLEAFPSIERAGRALQYRASRKVSSTYFWTEQPTNGSHRPGALQEFPEADATGFMRVWLRTPAGGPPASDAPPDELWHIAPAGGLRREKWADIAAKMMPTAEGVLTVPAEVMERAMTPAQRREKALAYAAELPPLTPEFDGSIGEAQRRALGALVADPGTLRAVLRIIQAARL